MIQSFVIEVGFCRMIAAIFALFSVLMLHSEVVQAASEADIERMSVIYCGGEDAAFKGEVMFSLKFLQTKQVQSELGLTDAQINKLGEALEKTSSVLTAPYAKTGYQNESFDEVEKKRDASRKRVAEILKPQQLSRFKGILVQLYGPFSLPKKDLRDVLRLTPEQKYQVDGIMAQLFAKLNEISDNPLKANATGTCKYVPVDNAKRTDIVNNSEKAFLNLLSLEQKQVIEKIKGKPLKLDVK